MTETEKILLPRYCVTEDYICEGLYKRSKKPLNICILQKTQEEIDNMEEFLRKGL